MNEILHLHVNHKYFVEIQNGTKEWEYRLQTGYWKKRLIGRDYKEVWIYDAYPKAPYGDKVIKLPYMGYDEYTSFKHRHFGDVAKPVFAIDLRKMWIRTV